MTYYHTLGYSAYHTQWPTTAYQPPVPQVAVVHQLKHLKMKPRSEAEESEMEGCRSDFLRPGWTRQQTELTLEQFYTTSPVNSSLDIHTGTLHLLLVIFMLSRIFPGVWQMTNAIEESP